MRKNFVNIIKRLYLFVPYSWRYPLYWLYYNFFLFYGSLFYSSKYLKEIDDIPLPPAKLRFRVHGSSDAGSFLKVGKTISENVKDALKLVNKDLSSFENVLDFAVGCARSLRWFKEFSKQTRFYGCDIDKEAISYDQEAVKFAEFTVNDPRPPLPYPPEKFDLIIAISVFTHLNEDYQLSWLKELERVAKPGAFLLISTHGSYTQSLENLSPDELHEIRKKGFYFQKGYNYKLIGLPSFYQTAYHTRQYILDNWSIFFKIRRFIVQGINNHQDLVILQKNEKNS